MKKALLSAVFMFIGTLVFAQKKAEEPASAPSQEDCTVAFYIQDSVAAQMSGFKGLADSAAALNKEIAALQAKLLIANDKMLHEQNDTTATIPEKDMLAKSKAAEESRNISGEITSRQNHLSQLNNKIQTIYFDTIASVAQRVALSRNIKKLTEINENYPMNCPPDKMIMIDITEAIIEEIK